MRSAETGQVIAGRGFDDGGPLFTDGLALPVRWGDRTTLPAGDLRLEFALYRAALYGFEFGDAAE